LIILLTIHLIIYPWYLKSESNKLINLIQQKYMKGLNFFESFFKMYQHIFSIQSLWIIFSYFYIVVHPLSCLKIMIISYITILINLFVKFLNFDGRPFWESSDVIGKDCNVGLKLPTPPFEAMSYPVIF